MRPKLALIVYSLLQLDHVIDLVIPRGSNKLVSQIKASTKIPVLGHAGNYTSPWIRFYVMTSVNASILHW